MSDTRTQLEATIAGLRAQRAVLGDALVDAALAPLLARLAALQAAEGRPQAPEAPAAPAQALRTVTLLFLDVVGFTALSRRLDPEDLHELIDGTLARCTAVVQAHGGRVMQYAGDQLLAVFGAPQAQEDDAERAVRCGLALLAEGRALGEQARRRAGAEAHADVRVGVHTGPALLGGGVDGEGTVRGLAVNVAARMEQTAPPGGLRISRATWRQVRGLFDAQAQPPLEVKGLEAPLATWLVHGVRGVGQGEAQRGVEGVATPLVGREAERATVRAALERAVQGGGLQRLTLLADAGLGKSRLLQTVAADAAAHPARPQVHRARAVRHGVHQPYGVLRHWLWLQAGVVDDDDADTARARLAACFAAPLAAQAEEAAALLGQLVGLDCSASPHVQPLAHDARQLRQRALQLLACWLQALAAQAPVLLLLDDMHWADEASLDALDQLAAACAEVPLLLAVFARPGLRERRPAWCADALQLAPLGAADAVTLLAALLQRAPAAPPALTRLLLEHADGNPFHLEELVAMCLDEGVLVPEGEGHWRVDEARLSALRVPPTLAGVLQARLDALDTAERRALQQASVVGHVHWDAALRHLAEDGHRHLPMLAQRELVVAHGSSAFADAQEFAFKHHLLHQATYDTVLRRERQAWHRGAAEWLVQASGGRVGEHLALVAEHFERAGDAAAAAAWWRRAADAAHGAAAFAAAEHHARRALALLAEDTLAERFELHAMLGRVYNAMARRDLQRAEAERLQTLADASAAPALGSRAAAARATVLLVTGDYAGSLLAAETAIALAQAAGEPGLALAPLADRGQALVFLGRLPEALACLDAALPLARAQGRTDLEAMVLNRTATVASRLGDEPRRVRSLHAALDAAQRGGHLRLQTALVTNVGVLALQRGRLDEARRHLEQALSITRAIGDRGSESYALLALADVAQEEGDTATALQLARQGQACAQAAQDHFHLLHVNLMLGQLCAARGEHAAARAHFATYADWQRQRGSTPEPQPDEVHMRLAEGRIAEARAEAAAQLAWLDAQPAGAWTPDEQTPARLLWAARAAALADGDAALAQALLQRAHAHVLAQAEQLPPNERPGFLQALRCNRLVVQACTAQRL